MQSFEKDSTESTTPLRGPEGTDGWPSTQSSTPSKMPFSRFRTSPGSGTESMIEIGREVLGDVDVFVVPIGGIEEPTKYDHLDPVLFQL